MYQAVNPSLVLILSVAVILILLRLKLHPGFAIAGGSLLLMLLVLPLNSVPSLMWQTLRNKQTLTLLVVVTSAMTLSCLMEGRGLLARLATTIESIGPRWAMHLVPAVIGFVAMPAGALVSGTALGGLVKRLGLAPEQSTFINYWFRHIWEFSLPLYPSVVITSAILSVPLFSVVKTLAPMTALAIVCGGIASYLILRKVSTTKVKGESARKITLNLLSAAWPILLLIVLILAKLDAMIVFPLVLGLLIGQQRARWQELKKSFKYGLNPRVLLLLYAVMLYKTAIETSGAATMLVGDMQAIGLPPVSILVGIPFLIGLATGYGPAFTGLALPLVVPYIVTGTGIHGNALILAFVSGMTGELLSPMHLCLALTVEYFKASLVKVYKYTLPLCAAMQTVVILLYIFVK
ncbi:MAG: DUF401 family protein [Chloroflexota bacterium]